MQLKRKITAIMAADIAEYSRLISEDEEEILRRLSAYREVFDDFVKRFGGRIFNTAGDAVMCEFPSAVEATRCAIDIQESLRTRNMTYPPDRQMHFRIGISIGDVVERDGDLLGDGVNIASRLESLAEAGGICVSRNVHEAVTNKISIPFRDLGEREVKNIPQPVHAFQVDFTGQAKGHGRGGRLENKSLSWLGLTMGQAGLALVLIAGGALIAAMLLRSGNIEKTPPLAAREPASPASTPSALPGTSVIVTQSLSPEAAFARLAQSGGIVAEPKTAPELYHNARSYEARGDNAQARRDYLALAQLGEARIDPLLRFAALVRAQDGRAGAREVFAQLAARGSPAHALVHALQFEGAERRKRLLAFIASHSAHAPAQYLLAEELGEDRQNAQTLSEKRQEFAGLEAFLAADQDGTLIPHFLDQSVLSNWLDRARKRRDALQRLLASGAVIPQAQFMRSNAGWMVSVSLPEAAVELGYKTSEMPDFRLTGLAQGIDIRTGKAAPNLFFELAGQQGATEIALRYIDPNGEAMGPYILPFDPIAALMRSQREILERFSNAWLAFGQGSNHGLLYYTHLMSYRCAIRRAEIGFNDDEPGVLLPLPPCDPADPHALPANALPYLRLSGQVKQVKIRLTFADDGLASEIKAFTRP